MSVAETKAPIIPIFKRRVRALTRLAAVTAVAVLLAGLALWQRSSSGQPDFKAEAMFPALQASIEKVTSLQIETKAASFNITRNAEGRWIVPDKQGYPADFNTVRKTILGLAELKLIEKRSARADWHDKLGLGLPKSGGTGTLVTFKDAKGEVLASLISGAPVEGASAGGRQAIYVRHPNEPQMYVASGTFAPPVTLAQWLDKSFIELARDRVKTAAIKPFTARAYSVTRAKPDDENFRVVEAIPAGRVLRTEGEANGVGNGLLGLSFDDVMPKDKLDTAKAASAAYLTFDGLTLNLSFVEKDRDFWMTVSAAADPGVQPPPASSSSTLKPDVAKEAKEINAVVAGWAYKIPRYKAVLLTSPLEDLLRPVGAPTEPGPNR